MRQRWRQPALLVGAVIAGLLAMRAAAPLAAPPGPGEVRTSVPAAGRAAVPVWLEAATGAELLLGVEDGLLWVDVDTRDVRAVPLPAGASGVDEGLVRWGGTVVAVRGGMAYAARTWAGGRATWLGPASYALASARPGRVWLVEQKGDPDHWFQVREVALAGPAEARSGPPAAPKTIGEPVERGRARVVVRGSLPLGQRPVAGVPGGLLAADVGPGGGLAVWDPRTGRTRLRLAAASPRVVATRGGLVAWVEGPDLHLGDLASGRNRVVPPLAGSDGFAPAGAFSPDGRLLAAVTRVGFSTRPALALVRVDQASATRVAGSEGALADRCSPCLAWTPTGDWVFFNRLGPRFAIGAYRLDRPRAATVRLDVPGSYPPSFAVL